ncbi:MAG TPA: hypothetical protein VH419_16340 [Nocardioidaceae bacterium]
MTVKRAQRSEDGPDGGRDPQSAPPATRSGFGRVLIAVYAVFAIAATGRSAYQLSVKASDAPIPYTLSLVAALIYVTATVALFRGGPTWRRVAWVACSIELIGVLVVGTVSVLVEFPDATVWSDYGIGYGFVPLVLPIFGLWWLRKTAPPQEGGLRP